MCDFSGNKVLHIFFLSLCLRCVLGKHEWVDVYKRCSTRQDLRRGCFLMSACRLGSVVENLLELLLLFFFLPSLSCKLSPRTSTYLSVIHVSMYSFFFFFFLNSLSNSFFPPSQCQWSVP